MSDWKDLDDFLDEEYLELPIQGRVYRIEDVDGETALRVRRLAKIGQEAAAARKAGRPVDESAVVLDDADEDLLYERVLGEAYEQMRADGVKNSRIKMAAQTAMVWIISDKDSARAFWEAGGDPEATGPAPNRASRRASAASARKTPSRASTKSTRASKSTAAARRSPGTTSSRSGR
ncbi:hypothetical protein [Actinomadura sp. 21ATH]|uniref:DUF7426 family protein n=1 Tax=Actinomadura sp. 21ATH TaxID=1735444 RepID=UPI0035BED0B7